MDKVNSTILLKEAEMEILIRSHGRNWISVPGNPYWAKVPAKAYMQLAPLPNVYIEIPNKREVLLISSLDSVEDDSFKLRLPSGPEIETFIIHKDQNSIRLTPTKEPVTIVDEGKQLQSLSFNVLNFPGLSDGQFPALFQAEPWNIEIKALPEFSEITAALKTHSGYGLTHKASVRRIDGTLFSAKEAGRLLEILHLFLSFARGGNCGITLARASDEHDEPAWEQWGTYPTHPWVPLSSWLDHRLSDNRQSIFQAFPGFWQVCSQNEWPQDYRARAALYWYLRSNESIAADVGTILTHAALERLAHELLGRKRSKELRSPAKKIRAVLRQNEICPALPDCTKELTALADHKSWCDGPETLTELRNDLVHAEMRTHVSTDTYREAHHLGQWYVELLLLKLFGYRGEYSNRLTCAYRGIYEQQLVPWAHELAPDSVSRVQG